MNYTAKLSSLTEEERKDFERAMMDVWIEGALRHTDEGGRILDAILAKRTPPQPVYEFWRPEKGVEYFVIGKHGGVVRVSTWDNDEFDKSHYAATNCFPTREAAEAESLRTTARRFYEHCCRVANGGTLLPKTEEGRMWIVDRTSVDSWLISGSLADTLVGVADKETALAIRAAMIEKGLLQHYFGE